MHSGIFWVVLHNSCHTEFLSIVLYWRWLICSLFLRCCYVGAVLYFLVVDFKFFFVNFFFYTKLLWTSYSPMKRHYSVVSQFVTVNILHINSETNFWENLQNFFIAVNIETCTCNNLFLPEQCPGSFYLWSMQSCILSDISDLIFNELWS